MRFCYLVPFLLFSTGCMSNQGLETSARASDNIHHLRLIEKGMTEAEVQRCMGPPYAKESYVIEEEKYDTWFYITKATILGQSRMVPQNLTPLTFLNGSLVGWGYPYYDKVKNRWLEEEAAKERTSPVAFFSFWQGRELAMAKKEPPPGAEPSETSEDKEDDLPLDEKDDKMLEEEKDQDFDYW